MYLVLAKFGKNNGFLKDGALDLSDEIIQEFNVKYCTPDNNCVMVNEELKQDLLAKLPDLVLDLKNYDYTIEVVPEGDYNVLLDHAK
jgi:hypothetical protein